MRRPMTTVGSRAVHKDRKVVVGDGDSDSTDYEDGDVYITKSEADFIPVKGEPGLFYKVLLRIPQTRDSDSYHKLHSDSSR